MGLGTKRAIVIAGATIIGALSIVSLILGGSITHIVLCALAIIASILGLLGAIQRNATWLFWFEILTVILFVYGLITIIISLVNNVRVQTLAWDIALVVLLAITTGATHDLRLASEW